MATEPTYNVLRSQNLGDLMSQVNTAMTEGWVPGDFSASPGYVAPSYDFFQTMTVGSVSGAGIPGPPGPEGPMGPMGPAAPYLEILSYIGDTSSTAQADPGTGKLRWNAATADAVTQLFIDRLDAQSDDVTLMWQMVNPTRMIIQEAGMALNTQEWTIGPLQMSADFFTVTATLVPAGTKGTGPGNFAPSGSSVRILLFLLP
jgi:hypothetical protein